MIRRFTLLMLITSLVTFFSACGEDDKPSDPQPTQNVYQLISGKAGYSMTVQIIDKAGLKSLLSGTSAITFFAPSDDALLAAGVDPNTMTADQLKDLLSYHMMDGSYFLDNIPSGGYMGSRLLDTVNSRKISLFLNKPAGIISVNGKQTLETKKATNGYIHFLNNALKPLSVYEHLVVNTDLAIYSTAVQIETTIRAILESPENVTVFASNKTAMETWLNNESKTITSIHPDKRKALLNNSIIVGEGKLHAELQPMESTLGLDLVVTDNGLTLHGTIHVVTADIQGTNGVLHIVDGVKIN